MKRILVVDDEADIRELIFVMLSRTYTIDTAEEGRMAFQMAQENRYDLILTDINMPNGMGGLELINLIQTSPQTAPPIVVMSGYNENECKLKGKIHQYLAKPFDVKKLKTAISEVLDHESN